MAFQHFRILLIAALILASILPLAIGSKAALAVDVITDVEENSPPVVKNVTARQEPGTATVEITYDVSDEHHTAVTISLDFWDGSAWQHCETVTPEGKIPVGEDCQVYWDAGADFPEHYVTDCKIEVTADDEYTRLGEPFNNLSSTEWPEPYRSEPFSPEFILDTRTEITPPVISDVDAPKVDITQTSAIVRWNTDEPATSQVAYSTTSHPGDYPGGTTIADVLADYGSWSAEDPTLVMIHAVSLSGLELDTTYYYRVLSRDASGNEAWSDEHWFKTKVDETPPTISGVEAPEAGITETSAIVRWNTDEPATSQVAYSTTSHAGAYASIAEVLTAYGSWSAEDASLVMVHAVALSGLDPGTEYFYRVLSRDVSDNEAWSDEYQFETEADETPPVISAVVASDITETSAIIRWNTNEPATSQVEYGAAEDGLVLDLPMDEGTGSTAGDLSEYGNDGTIYGATWVEGISGNALSFDGVDDYVDCGSDASLDIIGGFTVEMWVRSNSVAQPIGSILGGDKGIIFYQGATDGQDNSAMFGFRGEGEVYSTDGVIDVGTWIHLAFTYDGGDKDSVSSYEIYANGINQNLSIRTDGDIGGVSTSEYIGRDQGATFFNGLIDSVRIYNRALSITPLDPTLIMSHSVSLSGLDPDTTYHYRVRSMDAAGNGAVSDDYTFTTLRDEIAPTISGVIADNITDSGAIISWDTNEPATSQVEYGLAEDGLVLDLPMDEGAGSTAGDLSGYGNDGTIYGPTWVTHDDGYALSFDGQDDYVDCGSDASLDIIGGFTVEMWVRSNSVAQPIGSILGGDKGIIFYQGATDGQDNSAMFGFRGEGEVYSTDGVIDVGTWIHLAFTYDGGDKDSVSSYEIYANGINQNLSIRTDGDIGGVSTSEYIGRDQGATFFNGLIDSVRIYNRALSAEEVLEHYLDTSSGSSTPLDPTLVMSHSVSLSGLDPDTTYHYRVRSMDAAENEAISDDYTFTTLPDEIAPTISGVIADNITDSGAIISWDTNEPATSRVEYGVDTSYGSTTPLDPTLVMSHSVSLGGLEPDTTYHYRVRSMDAADNEAISDDYTFTTEPDTTPPQISDVITTNVGETSAIVQWLTDEPATSQVAYGTTSHAGETYANIAEVLAAYESSTTEDTELATNHGVALSGLSSGVTIYYRVLSEDGDGNEVWSAEYSFETTDTTPPALVWVDAVLITDTGAVIAWETDEDAYCQIVYSTTSHPGDYSSGDDARAAYEFSEPEETTPLLGHQAVIDGFTSGTTIYYRIISRDEAGNEAVSAEYSFTTT